MQRTTTTLLAALLIIGALAAVPAAMAQQTETEQTSQTNQTDGNATVSPGEQLSGIVGVSEAELSGEVESRAYDIKLTNANSSEEKAAILAEQLNKSEQRLAELEREKAALDAARENGSISEGKYRAKMATLHAESQSGARLVNQTNKTAGELPAETLEANGVNATAINALKDRSANLSGPETAAIAKSIAGKNSGQAARPEEAGARGSGGDRAGSDGDRAGSGGDRAGSGGDRAGPDRGSDTTTSTNETSDGSTASSGTSDGSTDSSGTSDGSTASSGTSNGGTNGGSNSGSSAAGRDGPN